MTEPVNVEGLEVLPDPNPNRIYRFGPTDLDLIPPEGV